MGLPSGRCIGPCKADPRPCPASTLPNRGGGMIGGLIANHSIRAEAIWFDAGGPLGLRRKSGSSQNPSPARRHSGGKAPPPGIRPHGLPTAPPFIAWRARSSVPLGIPAGISRRGTRIERPGRFRGVPLPLCGHGPRPAAKGIPCPTPERTGRRRPDAWGDTGSVSPLPGRQACPPRCPDEGSGSTTAARQAGLCGMRSLERRYPASRSGD